MSDHEWLEPILRNRTPDATCVLCDLVQAGIQKGEASANDVRQRRFEQPNVIGACFKILPKLGFVNSGRRVRTEGQQKHSRRVDVYELADRGKAEAFLSYQRRFLVGASGDGELPLPGF